MAAQYDFQRRPNPKGDGELQPLYPRIVNKGTTGYRIIYPKDIMFGWVIWDTSRQA